VECVSVERMCGVTSAANGYMYIEDKDNII
jgi:hypothetical protein